MTRGEVVLLSGVLLLVPFRGVAQETDPPARYDLGVTVSPGYTTAYRGGVSYLASVLLFRPSGIPLEAAFEFIPTAYGGAGIFWLGTQYPRGVPMPNLYAGTRAGLLKGPIYNGFLVDLHVGFQLGARGIGLRLEPALLLGADESIFVGARLAAGLSWIFSANQ